MLIKLPRTNTKTWAVLEFWARSGGLLSYIDVQSQWCSTEPRCSVRHAGMAVTRFLKKFGKKTGPAGSRSPWRLNDDIRNAVLSTYAPIERDQPDIEFSGSTPPLADRLVALAAFQGGTQ